MQLIVLSLAGKGRENKQKLIEQIIELVELDWLFFIICDSPCAAFALVFVIAFLSLQVYIEPCIYLAGLTERIYRFWT